MHTAVTSQEFQSSYNGQSITFVAWANHTNGPVVSVLFLGTLQVAKLPRWVAESCPPGTVVVQGLPHWYARDDGSDMPEFSVNFIRCAFDALINQHDFDKVNVIAESQAVPGVTKLLARPKYQPHLKQLILLQPLGLNSQAFAGSLDQRISVFQKRINANLVQQLGPLLTDRRLRYNHRLLFKSVNLRNAKDRAQYGSGLTYNAIPDLQQLYKVNPNIRIICGAKDKLFVPAEIQESLRAAQLQIAVTTVSGVPHMPLATRLGRRLLHGCFE